MENQFLTWLLPQLTSNHRLEVPPGDDAAVLRQPGNKRSVVTTDLLTESVDFRFAESNDDKAFPPAASAHQVGRKAIAVSLSDLAAMAATPEAVFVSVALPRLGGRRLAEEIFNGIQEEVNTFNVVLAGGDTNAWDGPVVINVTAIGSVAPQKCWRRDTARPDDLLIVTGPLGGSLLGRHLSVIPRCREALAIASRYPVNAALDISDGLAIDCGKMLVASKVGGIIDLEAVPIHPDANSLSKSPYSNKLSPLEHAMQDGEDFELLLSVPQEAAQALVGNDPRSLVPGTTMQPRIIGRVTKNPDFYYRTPDGRTNRLEPKGFEHVLE